MTDDTKQLREYAATGSDDAFAAVVQRYVSLVFAAALRRVGGGRPTGSGRCLLILVVAACCGFFEKERWPES